MLGRTAASAFARVTTSSSPRGTVLRTIVSRPEYAQVRSSRRASMAPATRKVWMTSMVGGSIHGGGRALPRMGGAMRPGCTRAGSRVRRGYREGAWAHPAIGVQMSCGERVGGRRSWVAIRQGGTRDAKRVHTCTLEGATANGDGSGCPDRREGACDQQGARARARVGARATDGVRGRGLRRAGGLPTGCEGARSEVRGRPLGGARAILVGHGSKPSWE